MSIAGIDIGTTGCKCTLYSNDGKLINESYAEYNISNDNGEHELDAIIVWACVRNVVKDISKDANNLKAIGITSFGESVVLLDKDDKPLMNSILYTDPRGEEQCKKLVNHFSAEAIARITGLNPHKMYSVSKLMWIMENKPLIYQNTKRILLFEDYIVYMLCGVAQIDYSLATRTMAFDIKTLNWSREILSFAGIDVNKMSRVVESGTKAGTIKVSLAEELGLPEEVIIVSGCHDQVAAAVGTGVLEVGMAVDGTGTTECITPVCQKIPDNDVLFKGSYSIVPHVIPNYYVSYAFSFAGGALLKWYRDNIASLEAQLAKSAGKNAFDTFNLQVEDEPTGLLVLPHFSGAGTPYMDSYSKGAIIGLTTETTSIDIYRALMEGVTYEMLLNIEKLKEAGIEIKELRATGGGAKSTVWLQMKSDILNIPVISLGASQSGTLGCVMLAGVACGIYKDIWEARNILLKIGKTYYPRKEKHEKYMNYYKKYKKLYEVIKELLI